MPSVDEVNDALSNVIDPELGLDFVELGLVYGIEVDGADVHIEFTLTSPGCPIGPQVTDQMKEFVAELDGVEQAEVDRAVVAHDRQREGVVLGQERDRDQLEQLAPEHVERELRPGHV